MYSLTNIESPNLGFYTENNFLSDEDFFILNKFSDSFKFEKALVHNDVNVDTRNTSIYWIKPPFEDKQIQDIFKKIRSKIIEINESVFQFELTDIEPIQYTRYHMGNFYKMHVDISNELLLGGMCRKLSFSIQLTDPSEYDGGDLLAYTSESPTIACKEKGSMTFFPSFLLHEVKPVTRGVRNALVGWCWGPMFK